MKKIIIVGGGISGLACAHYALKNGFHVELHEKSDRLGGMLSGKATPLGEIETAANGFLNSSRVEALFKDLGLELEPSSRESRRRYVFLKSPKRWPLTVKGTVALAKAIFNFRLQKSSVVPQAGESVRSWVSRVSSPEVVDHFVSPALQGVYGVASERLSADLIWQAFQQKSPRPAGPRGTVRPKLGMGSFHSAFLNWFKEKPITIYFGSHYELPANPQEPTILCTEAWTAAKMAGFEAPTSQGLTTVSLFFPSVERRLIGYGVLFPRLESFSAMGVLFERQIFKSSRPEHMERWIFAEDQGLSDKDWVARALKDRSKLYGVESVGALYAEVVRWPKALPVYDEKLKSIISELQLPNNLYLCGNYLGGIGLSKILDRAKATVETISEREL